MFALRRFGMDFPEGRRAGTSSVGGRTRGGRQDVFGRLPPAGCVGRGSTGEFAIKASRPIANFDRLGGLSLESFPSYTDRSGNLVCDEAGEAAGAPKWARESRCANPRKH